MWFICELYQNTIVYVYVFKMVSSKTNKLPGFQWFFEGMCVFYTCKYCLWIQAILTSIAYIHVSISSLNLGNGSIDIHENLFRVFRGRISDLVFIITKRLKQRKYRAKLVCLVV